MVCRTITVHNVHVTIIAEWKVLDATCSKIINKSLSYIIFSIFFLFKLKFNTIKNINRERHKTKIKEE